MNRVLGIDYGDRRIGLAISDPLFIIAKPLRIIDRKKTKNYYQEILKVKTEYNIEKIVVGIPLKLNGEHTFQTKLVYEFINQLSAIYDGEIITIDERFSSISAKNYLIEQGIKTGHNKGKIDELAAAIILQEYLDSKK